MSKIAGCLVLAVSLAACSVVDTLVDGFKHVTAVENDLAASTGMKPHVGFQWRNGRLETVTVAFPKLYESKPLSELAETVRRAVIGEFQQTPDDIVLAFSLGKAAAGTAAQLREPPASAARGAL
ncbi:MAG TPA: hypothetical protein VMR17_17180 [Xanthobacteraceae bacterium]|jgi:hypothetical protein|nr:hypothetical protein [Xanthobacteraceae bacterium]